MLVKLKWIGHTSFRWTYLSGAIETIAYCEAEGGEEGKEAAIQIQQPNTVKQATFWFWIVGFHQGDTERIYSGNRL